MHFLKLDKKLKECIVSDISLIISTFATQNTSRSYEIFKENRIFLFFTKN